MSFPLRERSRVFLTGLISWDTDPRRMILDDVQGLLETYRQFEVFTIMEIYSLLGTYIGDTVRLRKAVQLLTSCEALIVETGWERHWISVQLVRLALTLEMPVLKADDLETPIHPCDLRALIATNPLR